MIRLGINIDHVATLRQVRGGLTSYPNLVEAAKMVLDSGGDQITVHLRGDRRHIQDHDLTDLTQAKIKPLNLEMAATEEMAKIACKIKPEIVCLVPEKREELTTEGGLNLLRQPETIEKVISLVKKEKIRVSLFIEPDVEQIEMAAKLKADAVEFHTGQYALNPNVKSHLTKLFTAADNAFKLGIKVHAGHGLDYQNILPILEMPHLEEVNIGHSIVCRAIYVGMDRAVSEMKALIRK